MTETEHERQAIQILKKMQTVRLEYYLAMTANPNDKEAKLKYETADRMIRIFLDME